VRPGITDVPNTTIRKNEKGSKARCLPGGRSKRGKEGRTSWIAEWQGSPAKKKCEEERFQRRHEGRRENDPMRSQKNLRTELVNQTQRGFVAPSTNHDIEKRRKKHRNGLPRGEQANFPGIVALITT